MASSKNSSRVPGRIPAFNHLNIRTQTTRDAKWLLEVSIGCTQEPFMFWNIFFAFCRLPLFSIVTEVVAFLSPNKALKLNNAPARGKDDETIPACFHLTLTSIQSGVPHTVFVSTFSPLSLPLCLCFCCWWQPSPPSTAPTALWAA